MQIKFLQPSNHTEFGMLSVLAGKASKLVLKILDNQGRFLHTIVTAVEEGYQQIPLTLEEHETDSLVINAFQESRFIQSIRVQKA